MGVFKDVSGVRFGHYLVLGFSHKNNKGKNIWKVKCECCDTTTLVDRSTLTHAKQRNYQTCHCVKNDIEYLVGKKFGCWEVQSFDCTNKKSKFWICKCDCGNTKSIRTSELNVISKREIQTCRCDFGKGNDAAINMMIHYYKRNASKRNLEYCLERSEFVQLIMQNCHYCGTPPCKKQWSSSNTYNVHILVNGIDRKDNSLGYQMNNCIPCCQICNQAKKQLEYNKYIEYLTKLTKFRTSSEEQDYNIVGLRNDFHLYDEVM